MKKLEKLDNSKFQKFEENVLSELHNLRGGWCANTAADGSLNGAGCADHNYGSGKKTDYDTGSGDCTEAQKVTYSPFYLLSQITNEGGNGYVNDPKYGANTLVGVFR